MAIRLRDSLGSNNPTPSLSGFNLVFSNNTVYDLDKIFENKSRTSADSKLVLEVKKDEEISKKVIAEFDKIITDIIDERLKDPTVNDGIFKIINSAMTEYGVLDTTTDFFQSVVLKYINSKINLYLKSIYSDYGINYSITINGKEIKIGYTVSNDDKNTLSSELEKIYKQYSEKYQKELEDVDVGGLAISDRKIKTSIKTEDYQKYLLDGNCPGNKPTSGYSEPGTRRPLVIWSEMTEDPNTESSAKSLLDQLDELKQQVILLTQEHKKFKFPDSPDKDGEYYLECNKVGYEEEISWKKLAAFDYARYEILSDKSYNIVFTLLGSDLLSDGSFNYKFSSSESILDDNSLNIISKQATDLCGCNTNP